MRGRSNSAGVRRPLEVDSPDYVGTIEEGRPMELRERPQALLRPMSYVQAMGVDQTCVKLEGVEEWAELGRAGVTGTITKGHPTIEEEEDDIDKGPFPVSDHVIVM